MGIFAIVIVCLMVKDAHQFKHYHDNISKEFNKTNSHYEKIKQLTYDDNFKVTEKLDSPQLLVQQEDILNKVLDLIEETPIFRKYSEAYDIHGYLNANRVIYQKFLLYYFDKHIKHLEIFTRLDFYRAIHNHIALNEVSNQEKRKLYNVLKTDLFKHQVHLTYPIATLVELAILELFIENDFLKYDKERFKRDKEYSEKLMDQLREECKGDFKTQRCLLFDAKVSGEIKDIYYRVYKEIFLVD